MVLVLHWFVSPFVIGTWTKHYWAAGVFSFIFVFILWSLNGIASELENPFEADMNDLDMAGMQQQLNARLLMLLDHGTTRTPQLSAACCMSYARLKTRPSRAKGLVSIADIIANPPSEYEGPRDSIHIGHNEYSVYLTDSMGLGSTDATKFQQGEDMSGTSSKGDNDMAEQRKAHLGDVMLAEHPVPPRLAGKDYHSLPSPQLSKRNEDAQLIGHSPFSIEVHDIDKTSTPCSSREGSSREDPSRKVPRQAPLLQPISGARLLENSGGVTFSGCEEKPNQFRV